MTTDSTNTPGPAPAKKLPFWIDFGPLVLFYVSFLYWKKQYPDEAIIWAAGVLAVAAILALIYAWWKYKHTSAILIFSTLMIGGFALAAFIFDDKRFVFMKPTVVNIIFGAITIGGVFLKKNVIKMVMGGALELPDAKWNVLAIRYGLFCFAMAILNEYVWRNYSETFWASFKLALMLFTVLFTLTQIPFLLKNGAIKE